MKIVLGSILMPESETEETRTDLFAELRSDLGEIGLETINGICVSDFGFVFEE